MIALLAPEFDLAGSLALPNAAVNNPFNVIRRGSVTPTLDGGSVVYDTGASISDVTVTARVRGYTQQTAESLRYLCSYYPELILLTSFGVYMARPGFSTSGVDLTLQLRLLRRLDG